MATTRVVIDRRAVAKILHSREVAADLRARALRVAAAARTTAPKETGRYTASITVRSDHTPTRARSRVYAAVPYATKVESRDRVLGRALDAGRG